MAEELVENPAYKAWAAFKPGTTVTRTVTIEITRIEGMDNMPGGAGARKMPEQTMTQKLTAVDADTVVVETTVTGGIAGRAEQPPRRVEIPAKIEKSKVDSALATEDGKATVKNVKDGTDTMEIKGKTLTVKTKEMDVDMDRDGQKVTSHVKVWLSETVPGAAAKVVMNSKANRGPATISMAMTTTLVDYAAEK
jgi:hypothetical protein